MSKLYLTLLLLLLACTDDGCRSVEPEQNRFVMLLPSVITIGAMVIITQTPIYETLYQCPDGTRVWR